MIPKGIYYKDKPIIKAYKGNEVIYDTKFDPLVLFAGGKQGVWYDPSDKTTLFQYAAGTVLVTTNGNPVGKILDKSGNNNHATQTVSAARPLYNTEPSRLLLDKVDDAIVINFPKRIVGSMTIATTTGTATYGVDIPQGNLTLRGAYFPSNNIVGLVINEGELSEKDKSKLVKLFVGKGAIESFASNTSLANAFMSWNFLTSFPLVDTSSVTSFFATWFDTKLTSFPLIDTSSGTNFRFTWYNTPLTIFPKNAFDNIKGGDFGSAFGNTNLNQESIDGILVSLVTSGIATGTRVFSQSGGSAPSAIGNAAINTLRSRGWTVTVTGGY